MKFVAIILSFLLPISAFATTGAGASFPAPVYFKWAEIYQKETGKKINYQSIGSSGGLKQIDTLTVDFGATDEARSQKDLDEKGQIQFPVVMGGVVAVVNVPGVAVNQINLSSKMLADVFAGKVTNWKEIDAKLPDMPITIVHRADGSGTTSVFTNYLASVSPTFKSEIGAGKSVNWKGKTVAGKGNAGVAAMVKQIKGTIGYVEFAYAKSNNLITTKIDGVEPNLDTFKSKKWVLTAETYIIVYPNDTAKAAVAFFDWCYKNDKIALELDYVPLSDKSKAEVRALWKKHNLH